MDGSLLTPELLWFVGGLLFLLAELATPGGFVLMFFGAGCWVAALASVLHFGLVGQLVAFVSATVLFLLTLRRLFVRIFRGKTLSEDLEHDESPVGHRAEVTRPITSGAPGEIRYRGSFWRAYAEEDIAPGTSVIISGSVPGESSAFTVERPPERPTTPSENKENQ